MSATPTSTTAPSTLMTVDEYWDYVNLPENDNKCLELRHGEVIELSRPTRKHGIVTADITFQLQLYGRSVGRGYVASNDSGVVLEEEPATVVGPDVAYFADDRTFDELPTKWGDDVPVLAVEVLSPNDRPSEVNEKVSDYLRCGVKLVWLVDYEARKVTVYRPDRTLGVLASADILTGGEEMPGLSIPVAEFFRTCGALPSPPDAPQPPTA